ncbi:MAG: sodium:proton antiporter [Verrucomicrobiales bacterium]|nr:sodium:proton antiporter [Verrucomicrobiales bacterium]
MELPVPNPWMLLPFVALLAMIATGPVLFPNLWAKHYPKAALVLAVVVALYYLLGLEAYHRVFETAHEYVSFIAIIGALYVVSGGIHIRVKGEATPWVNVLFLLTGAIISNVLGTTGASMLLIRPWLRMNKYRVTAHHVVFFIFIVSNVGGCLTPIGDPPLFLGYLEGVPFFWVLQQCWPMWLVANGILLTMFFVVDSLNYHRAPKTVRDKLTHHEEWRFDGMINLVFLAIILAAVFIKGPMFLREIVMLGAASASYFITRKSVHESNDFNFHPIMEVAILFIGIFITMMPAMDWLKSHAGQLGDLTPALVYWSGGALSSVLDNAPTYYVFFGILQAKSGATAHDITPLLQTRSFELVAISVAAVFFGANTYIGNGPNFMVKAIAQQQKIHTPSFFGYILKFSLPFMLPMLFVLWLIFFRH